MQKKINKRRQKTNHARTKRRVKVLHLKMFFRRVMDKRHKKVIDSHKTPGITIIGKAKDQAQRLQYITGGFKLRGRINQRQKRKLWSQAPYMRQKRA